MSEYIIERDYDIKNGTFSTVKREEIVRCRDCLRVSYDGVLSTGWCNENCREVRPFDFCAWGERREDA